MDRTGVAHGVFGIELDTDDRYSGARSNDHLAFVYDDRDDRFDAPPDDSPNADRPSPGIDRTIGGASGRGGVGDDPVRPDRDEWLSDGRIVPLLADAGNRQVAVEWLDGHYDVVAPAEATGVLRGGRVDCVLVDTAAFDRYHDPLIERKDAEAPRILPYLLVNDTGEPPADPELREYVDEVIATPVNKRTLAWRLDSLLTTRRLSLDLAREREQLERLAEAAAHDLRNPLNIAKGYLRGIDDDRVEPIARAHDRMEHLIEGVLTVARTAERIGADEVEPVDLAALVAGCWEIIPGERAVLDCRVGDGFEIRAKPILVEQLVDNLLRNAVVHGPDGVTVRVGPLDDGFYVEDDGPGIPEAERGRVFDSGYTTGSGSGLGLAVVERVCEAHGWEVSLAEGRDGGARFEITGARSA